MRPPTAAGSAQAQPALRPVVEGRAVALHWGTYAFYRSQVAVPTTYYNDSRLDAVLSAYADGRADVHAGSTQLNFPVGALRCIAAFLAMCGDADGGGGGAEGPALLVLSSDKGFTHPAEFHTELFLQKHQGSRGSSDDGASDDGVSGGTFSLSSGVNYDALRLFFEARGGVAFLDGEQRTVGLPGFSTALPPSPR